MFLQFENVENLGGKAWEHATAIDLISNSKSVTVFMTNTIVPFFIPMLPFFAPSSSAWHPFLNINQYSYTFTWELI